MKPIKYFSSILCLLLLIIEGCSSNETKEKESTENIAEENMEDSAQSIQPVKLINDYNDIALFLAGKKLRPESDLSDFSNDSIYIRYCRKIEKKFNTYNEKQLKKIYSWSEQELPEINQNSKEILYPFSGPDIIHALTLFPKGENFYLYGLEPVGEIPNIYSLGKDSTNRLFSSLNNAISDNLFLSFFLTNEMKKDLNSTYIRGTIPILMFFISRLNYHVQEIKPVEISDDGELVYTPVNNDELNMKNYKNGVEITVIDTSSMNIKKVYYFSIDLSDPVFKKNTAMQNFLTGRKAPLTTLVKSASYCLHGAKYHTIRNLILTQTKYLLQDDTGVPYFILDSTNWNIKLYGSYTRPVKIFANQYQNDFKLAMDEKAKPVNFRFGYTNLANILYGIKD